GAADFGWRLAGVGAGAGSGSAWRQEQSPRARSRVRITRTTVMGTATTVTRPTIRDVTPDIARDITVTTTAVRTSAIGTGVTGNRAHAHRFGPLRRRFAAFLRARDCLVTVHVSPARRRKRGVQIFHNCSPAAVALAWTIRGGRVIAI